MPARKRSDPSVRRFVGERRCLTGRGRPGAWFAWAAALVWPWSVATVAGAAVAESGAAAPVEGPASRRGELVVVLRPSDLDDTMRTVLARVVGELAAARFQVQVGLLDLVQDPAQQLEAAVSQSRVLAAFAIEGGRDTLTIRVFDRASHVASIQRIEVRQGDIARDAQALALEAVEWVRVSLANSWPMPPSTPPPTSPASPPPTAPRAPPVPAAPVTVIGAETPQAGSSGPGLRRPPVSVGLGIALLRDLGLSSSHWMASLHAEVRASSRLAVHARFAGLGPSTTVAAPDGSATMDRQIGSLGGAWYLWTGTRADLHVTAAIGAEHVSARGTASDPTRGAHEGSAWSPLVLSGLGATVHGGPHVAAWARLDGAWAWSPLQFRIGSALTDPLSRPAILGDLGVQVTF